MGRIDQSNLIDRIHRIQLYVVSSNSNSTNVRRMKYDSIMRELVIEFWGGGVYTYYAVPENIYESVRNGDASTRTAGDWGPVGKTPSVGAAVHQFLVESDIRYTRGGTI